MAFDSRRGYCPACGPGMIQRPATNHLLHFVITVFLCGLWLPVWALASVKIGGWTCARCGRSAATETPEARRLWLVALAVIGAALAGLTALGAWASIFGR